MTLSKTFKKYFKSKKEVKALFFDYVKCKMQKDGQSKQKAIKQFKKDFKNHLSETLIARINNEWTWKVDKYL